MSPNCSLATSQSVIHTEAAQPSHKVNPGCGFPSSSSLPHPMSQVMLWMLTLSHVRPGELHSCLLRGRNNSPFLRNPGERLDFIVAS